MRKYTPDICISENCIDQDLKMIENTGPKKLSPFPANEKYQKLFLRLGNQLKCSRMAFLCMCKLNLVNAVYTRLKHGICADLIFSC